MMSTDASTDWAQKATIAFQKLSPRPGDLLTVTAPSFARKEQLEMIAVYIEEVLADLELTGKVGVMIVQGGIEINNLPAERMEELGWVRKE